MRLVDERCLEVSQKDALDLMSALDLSPADLQQQQQGRRRNPVASFLFNNPLVKALQLRRILGALGYVREALRDSFEGPNARRLVWPGSVALVLAFWFGNALESIPLKYLVVVMAHAGPIYNRGEVAMKNRKERRPIKWKKIGLAVAFMAISSGASYALGCVGACMRSCCPYAPLVVIRDCLPSTTNQPTNDQPDLYAARRGWRSSTRAWTCRPRSSSSSSPTWPPTSCPPPSSSATRRWRATAAGAPRGGAPPSLA